MRGAVIGVRAMGQVLARGLGRLGNDVLIASARGPEQLRTLAAELGATSASTADAVRGAAFVVLAIPTKAVVELPPRLLDSAPTDVIVIDIGNDHPSLRDGIIEAIERGMPDSAWVGSQIGRPVIKAFNSVGADRKLSQVNNLPCCIFVQQRTRSDHHGHDWQDPAFA